MKNKIIEIHKLPHIFKYLQIGKSNFKKERLYMNSCDKLQTDFYLLEKPEKNLVRLI